MKLPIENSVSKFFALASLLIASVGTANALPVLWVDTYNPTDVLVTAPNALHITHDITDDGYRPGIDSIYGAALYVNLYDDGDLFSSEKVSFSFDGSSWTPSTEVVGTSWWVDTLWFDVTSLVTDGILNISLKATSGDFYFADSTLAVLGNRAAVPEPISIAMFGIGLLALGAAMKRRQPRIAKLAR